MSDIAAICKELSAVVGQRRNGQQIELAYDAAAGLVLTVKQQRVSMQVLQNPAVMAIFLAFLAAQMTDAEPGVITKEVARVHSAVVAVYHDSGIAAVKTPDEDKEGEPGTRKLDFSGFRTLGTLAAAAAKLKGLHAASAKETDLTPVTGALASGPGGPMVDEEEPSEPLNSSKTPRQRLKRAVHALHAVSTARALVRNVNAGTVNAGTVDAGTVNAGTVNAGTPAAGSFVV